MTQTTITAATVATADVAGSAVKRQFNESALSLKLNFAGLNAADATFEIQESDDGTNWYVNTGTVTSIASGSSNVVYNMVGLASEYYRPYFRKGTNSAGTIGATLTLNKN